MATAQELLAQLHAANPYRAPTTTRAVATPTKVTMPTMAQLTAKGAVPTQGNAGAILDALQAANPYAAPTRQSYSTPAAKVATVPHITQAQKAAGAYGVVQPTQGNVGSILDALQAANPSGIRATNPTVADVQKRLPAPVAPKYAALPNGTTAPTKARSTADLSKTLTKASSLTTPEATLLSQLKPSTRTFADMFKAMGMPTMPTTTTQMAATQKRLPTANYTSAATTAQQLLAALNAK